ncbi:MAG TPA: type II CAAX endopeptidase family protein [Candidatus Dormibacteraeota bacterium]|nr:type II CAAX endopeptidase family protein [Candidatus Dormibacteraeota bacterium]
MSTASAEPVQSPRSLRQLIASHPVAVMLLLMFAIGWAFLIPAALAGVPLIPFPLLGAIFLAQLGPAVLVTWAGGGWTEVRHLFGRIFRWRIHPAWYLLALLGIPIMSLLWTAVVFGGGAVHALFTNRSVIEDYLSTLTILPIVSLWEETAWMGIVQARLATYRGPLLAAVIAGPLFGLLHMPLLIGQPVGNFLFTMAALMVFGIPFRIVLGWIYNMTGGSILIVALVHVTFDATNNGQLLAGASPGLFVVQPGGGAVHLVVLAWAVAVLILTRGRLGARDTATAEASATAEAEPMSAS